MSKLKVTELELEGVKIIEPKVFPDNRGCSFESYGIEDFHNIGIMNTFVLDYQAVNLRKNTLRGIHCQNNPHAQVKLVRALSGAILDVAVDLRKDSPTYKKWVKHILSADNHQQLFIPRGFGHGFLTLEDNTSVLYKFDDYYHGESGQTIRWNDPELAIDWGIEAPIMSEKDAAAGLLCDSMINFTMWENG